MVTEQNSIMHFFDMSVQSYVELCPSYVSVLRLPRQTHLARVFLVTIIRPELMGFLEGFKMEERTLQLTL